MLKKLKENLIKYSQFLILTSVGLIILFSLFSFSSQDNSVYKFDSTLKVYNNILGYLGSLISDILIRAFGYNSYFLPIFLLSTSFRIVTGRPIKWYSFACFPFFIMLICFFSVVLIKELSFFGLDGGFLGEALFYYFETFYSSDSYYYYLLAGLGLITTLALTITFNIGFKNILELLQILKTFISFIFKIISKGNIKINFFDHFKIAKSSKSNFSGKRSLTSNKKRGIKANKFIFPSIKLLEEPKIIEGLDTENRKNAEINKALLSNVLTDFKISGQITDVKQGPIVTLFELKPAPGTLTSSVISRTEDIARSMSAISARISTIPGKDALGIEIPNKRRETVYLRELLSSNLNENEDIKLPLALGKDIFGNPVIVDLARMPHLLVAGTTGSGKSVGINAMLLSLLFTLTPEECRLILIDPKMLELSIYQDIPHLLTEVVTDPKKAVSALKWSVKEMEMRYQMMSHLGVREIDDYNKKVRKILEKGEVIFKEIQVGYDSETGKPVMEKKALDLNIFPKIVVVVDELADLMLTSGKEIEGAIQRLSQMARASGIHLIVATQRPSVDVITGTIKSNFPTRISYKVVNKVNSRTIIEEQGAEQLLGQGDLLITMLGERLKRVHGPFVQTEEVQAVAEHLRKQGEPEYLHSVTIEEDEVDNFNLGLTESGDELYDKAVYIVCREKKASTSFIQRHLQIGYNRAARIIERMESEGVVSPANHVGRREVLVGKGN
ncbi:MAG: DNA translocase FtsK 4TM domain-containing protein [Alphaproteobacteria bacterium]